MLFRPRKHAFLKVVVLACWTVVFAVGQTTEGLISGRLLDSRTGAPIAGARIESSQETTSTRAEATSDSEGYYDLPLLPPGSYSVRVTAPSYQSQEAQELDLAVAGRLELTFLLRPLKDVWEKGLYRSVFLPGSQTVVTFYGPDVDPSHSGNFEGNRGMQGALESTVSHVINLGDLKNIPLAGRNAYTLLFTLPAVTSDGGVSRGLGFSVNGQRPSSSNYLLDGVENNNYLVTGPLTPVAPEAIQEYRISTSDYTAQYGRTAGFIANAVTKSGTDEWHGVGYYYTKNEALDANKFQRNLNGLARPLDREVRPGFQIGGPVLRNMLYASGAFEHFTGRQKQDPQTFNLPTPNLVASLPAGSPASNLLTQFPSKFTPPVSSLPCNMTVVTGCSAPVVIAPPLSLNQSVALLRLDAILPGGKHRLMGRASSTRLDRPDFLWSPYEAFTSGYDQTDFSATVSHQYTITPHLTNEARVAHSVDNIGWGEYGQIPSILVSNLTMPGSTQVYPYSNYSSSTELLDNLMWNKGSHTMTFGGGIMFRYLKGFNSFQGNGIYTFAIVPRFMRGMPDVLRTSISRSDLTTPITPDFSGSYSNRQYFLFAQDSFRVTSRLQLNFGLRYENLGAAKSIGSNPTAALILGSGDSLPQRLQNSTLNLNGTPSGNLYDADNLNFAVRFGFSYNLLGNGNTLLRGGYGTYYDRPFDNLWQTARSNNLDFAQIIFSGAQVDFTQPVYQALPGYAAAKYRVLPTSVPNLTLFQPRLRNGYAQHMFLGLQQRITEKFTLEVNGLSALGRVLMTNDLLGYGQVFNGSKPGIPAGQLVTYRANQGKSNYYAFAIKGLYRSGRGLVQVAYTWSHSIDNQSDPLGLDLSNYGYSTGLPAASKQQVAGFSQPYDSQADRGSSDFDERHNFVVTASYDLQSFRHGRMLSALTENWTVAGVGALRSGFPYSVYALGGLKGFTRANIVVPAQVYVQDKPGTGGEYLLNPAAFSGVNGPGQMSGRNAFTGPGFVNFDLSVARSFQLYHLPESWRLAFRADFFNVLNHPNLNSPNPVYTGPTSTTFGLATYGLNAQPAGFPTPLPLGETPRQIQLSARLMF